MTWDGTVWVKSKRPLTKIEKARRLKVDVAASGQTCFGFLCNAVSHEVMRCDILGINAFWGARESSITKH
jgi:hypothetical protein